MNIRWQVHRFGNYVAIYIPGSETIYFKEKEARKFSQAIKDVAHELNKKIPFTESKVGTKSDIVMSVLSKDD